MTKRINITMSPVYIKRLKTISRKMGITVSEVIRRSVDNFESHKIPIKKLLEEIKKDGLKDNRIQI
jgi:macrodomain Ter protein organizer (MatP/YcbG family)